jgi:hypothetical protein
MRCGYGSHSADDFRFFLMAISFFLRVPHVEPSSEINPDPSSKVVVNTFVPSRREYFQFLPSDRVGVLIAPAGR